MTASIDTILASNFFLIVDWPQSQQSITGQNSKLCCKLPAVAGPGVVLYRPDGHTGQR